MSLIEFCGLPGSGKSTISRLVVDRLKAESDVVVDRTLADNEIQTRYVGAASISTAAQALTYGLCRPRWARATVGVLGRSYSRRTIRSLIRIQNQLRLSLALGTTHRLVVDEWFIHEAWLASAESPRVRVSDLEPLLHNVSSRLACVPRMLVRLTAQPAVAAARVLGRPEKTWFQQLPQPDLARLLESAHASLDVLCRTCADASTRVLAMDTTDAMPAEIANELVPRLRGF